MPVQQLVVIQYYEIFISLILFLIAFISFRAANFKKGL